MSEQQPELTITRRRLPHWALEGSIYFVTFRVLGRHLSQGERRLVMDHIRRGHPRFYHLLAVVVMPDHVHMLLRPRGRMPLSRIMKGLKGASARNLNRARGSTGSVWLDESWDRIVRNDRELLDKIDYMLHNPVRPGLTDHPWEYDGWYWSGETDLPRFDETPGGRQECLPHHQEGG